MSFGHSTKTLWTGSLMLVLLFVSLLARASTTDLLPFKVHDIRVEGLQRIPVEKVYAALPIQPGDTVTRQDVADAVRRLFATGNYEDVQLGRDGDDLVVVVSERPSIARIDISGNKSISEDDLRKGLSKAGLSAGNVYQRSTLQQISGELERQYVAQGRYGASVNTEVVPLSRNRVALKISIYEGNAARISDINIIGNKVFDDDTLRDQFELSPTHFWSFIEGDDKYSRARLSGDLERLRSYYMDRGYIDFSIESTQVSVTPDRERVQITINVAEGSKYTVNDVKLAGNLVVGEKALRPLLVVQKGQTFSQKRATETSDLIKRRLGNAGYTFAQVHDVEQKVGTGNKVDVTFFVDPGKRVYVRRIKFKGNIKTEDEVMRRELRQFESAPANSSLIDLSRERLQRLGYFSKVDADTEKVPGTEDQVDVDYDVEEQPSGSIGANVGYSDSSGLIFGGSITQNNFRGTGDRVSFSLSRSAVRDYYHFSHYDPYYTLDGVSRGFSLFYSKVDFDEDYYSTYAADRSGGSVTFGYPISEYTRINFGGTFERISVVDGDYIAWDIDQFLQTYGRSFDDWEANLGIRTSTLNRGQLPDRGWSAGVSLEVAVPGSDYTFYKVNADAERYFPITQHWTLHAKGRVGYGSGYGDYQELPFFENYYAGGISSVRGYQARSLGPRSPALYYCPSGGPESACTDPNPDPVGANLLTVASLELIFPTPFAEDSDNIRTFLFADAGNVFQTDGNLSQDFSVDELRTSVGVGLSWLTAIGPLSFSLGKAINDQPGDDTEMFQFSLGQTF